MHFSLLLNDVCMFWSHLIDNGQKNKTICPPTFITVWHCGKTFLISATMSWYLQNWLIILEYFPSSLYITVYIFKKYMYITDWTFMYFCCSYRSVEANRPTSPIRTQSTYRPTPQRKPPPKPSGVNIFKVSGFLQCHCYPHYCTCVNDGFCPGPFDLLSFLQPHCFCVLC